MTICDVPVLVAEEGPWLPGQAITHDGGVEGGTAMASVSPGSVGRDGAGHTEA
jgi:hypothetical protein